VTQTFQVTQPLTEDERRKVQAYAESLIASRPVNAPGSAAGRIDVDALYGMFAGIGGDKSDKELLREAWDDQLAKFDR
jgi:hypothetical protein